MAILPGITEGLSSDYKIFKDCIASRRCPASWTCLCLLIGLRTSCNINNAYQDAKPNPTKLADNRLFQSGVF